MKAQRRSKGTAPPSTSALDGSGKRHASAALPPGKNPSTHGVGARCAPEPVSTCLEMKKNTIHPKGITNLYISFTDSAFISSVP
jgi:hypothetical protein